MFVDPDTYEVAEFFPDPEGGIPTPQEGPEKQGPMILRFRTLEQKAHHIFWSNGTRFRIDAIVLEGKRGAGVRKILRWLLTMRAKVVNDNTGFLYRVVVTSDRSVFEKAKKLKTERSDRDVAVGS